MSNSTRADALLAGLPRAGRGRLKVFLGAAPGVGKTYAMLQAAHAQQRQGVKVLAAVVETHGRSETEALLGGLPQQPLLRSEYRGVTLEEMDLDALLQAAPPLALVDELAHSNAPGSRHAKRWQDVQELLAAGIDVYTTVNVQHLESLNDKVRDITGVQVRETVPDWVLQEAFELVLIDLPPRELLERLREGKVYVPEQARAAIDAFFSQTNLTALRELAMQTAAAQVDADLAHGYRQRGEQAPALRGRLLVGIDGDAQAERLRQPRGAAASSAVERGACGQWPAAGRGRAPAPASGAATGRTPGRRSGGAACWRGGAHFGPACAGAPGQPGAGRPVPGSLAPPCVRCQRGGAAAA